MVTPGERSRLVLSTANRLRLVQADLADESPEVRQQYLADEVERALSKVVPSERAAVLKELMEIFPSWDTGGLTAKGAAEAMDLSTTDMKELKDASFLLTRLIELAPSMSAEDRRKAAVRLREAGLSTEGRNVWPEQAAEMLRAHLKMPDGQSLDPARTLEVMQMLIDLLASLDQVGWTTWKAINPRSEVRGGGEWRKSLPAYLSGNQDIPRGEVTQQLERLRQLMAALVSAISQTGRQYAQQQYARFAPDAIEDTARREKKTLESVPVASWRKYRELWGTSDQATIERDIMQLIAEYAERLMKGLSR